MTSDRPYRLALDPADALREVVEGRGTQFAPAIVDAFVRAMAAPARPVRGRKPAPGRAGRYGRVSTSPAWRPAATRGLRCWSRHTASRVSPP